jgi:hypothetical protein
MLRAKRAARKQKLTELFVTKVKPKDKRFLVWDTKQHGLALQVEPTGAKAFKAIYSRHGQPRWFNIGKTSAIGLADARKLVSKTMAAVAEGKDPAAEKKAERAAGTFADLAVRYVEEYAKKNNKSWEQAAYLIRSYVLPYWSKLQARSISRADVKALMRRLDNRPALANQVLAATSAIFTWAEGEEILAANPCKQVKRNETGHGCASKTLACCRGA